MNIPDDAWVLKCRTDKTFNDIGSFEPFLVNDIDFNVTPMGDFPLLFNYKVVVSGFKYLMLTCPSDMIFYGHKSDIQKSSFFMSSNRINGIAWQDAKFFSDSFLLRNTFVYSAGQYLRFGSMDFKHAFGRFAAETSDESFLLPKCLNRFFATVFTIIYTHFLTADCDDLEDGLSFREILASTIQKNRYPIIGNTSAEKLVTGNVIPTKGYEAFLAEVENIKQSKHCVGITDDEYDELVEFGKHKLGLEPSQWLAPRNRTYIPKADNNTDYNKTVQRFFNDGFDMEFLEYLNRPNAGLLSDLIHNIEYFKDTSQYFYMLFSGSCLFGRKLTYLLTFYYLNDGIPNELRSLAWDFIDKATSWGTFYSVDLSIEQYKLIFYYYFSQIPEAPTHKKENLLRSILEELTLTKDTIDALFKKDNLNYSDELINNCIHFIQAQDERHEFDYRSISIIELLSKTQDENRFPSEAVINRLIGCGDYTSLLKIMELIDVTYAREMIFDKKCAEYLFKYGKNKEAEFYLRNTHNKASANDILWLVFKNMNTADMKCDDLLFSKVDTCTEPFIRLLLDIRSGFLTDALELTRLPVDIVENTTYEQFILLIKLLLDFKAMEKNKNMMTKIPRDIKKDFAVALFIAIERNKDIAFFSFKNGYEFWIFSKLASEHDRIKSIYPSGNWIDTDININSPFVGCIEFLGDKVKLSVKLDVFARKYDFPRWKLLKDIAARSGILTTENEVVYTKEYYINLKPDSEELEKAAANVICNFDTAKNELLSILNQDGLK